MSAIARALSVAAFATAVNVRMTLTRVGAAAGVSILLLGSVLSVSSGRGWALDADLGAFGFLVAAVFGIRSGLEEQRETGLALFLRQNLVSTLEHAVGTVLGLLAGWLLLCALFFGVALVAGADAASAGWHVGAWGSRSLLLLGFVPLVETLATLRIPFILPTLAYLGLIIGVALGLGEEQALALVAPVDRGDIRGLLAVAARAAVGFLGAVVLFVGWSMQERRLGRGGGGGWWAGRRRGHAR